jgi:hypothetical protein
MIRNSHIFHLGQPLSFDGKRNGAAIKCAMLMLLAVLLAASPLPVSAATPDPVLEWIGIMNTTVIAGGCHCGREQSTGEQPRGCLGVVISIRCCQRHRPTIPAAACETGCAASRFAACSSDSSGLRDSRKPISGLERSARHSAKCIARGTRVDRKCSIHCWGSCLGTDCCERYLDVEVDRRKRAPAAAIRRRARHRRGTGCRRRLASDPAA